MRNEDPLLERLVSAAFETLAQLGGRGEALDLSRVSLGRMGRAAIPEGIASLLPFPDPIRGLIAGALRGVLARFPEGTDPPSDELTRAVREELDQKGLAGILGKKARGAQARANVWASLARKSRGE